MLRTSIANFQNKNGFWSDKDVSPPAFWRIRDRVGVGQAATIGDTLSGFDSSLTWLPNSAAGANWILRDSQFSVMQDRGTIAVSGLSRASDGDFAHDAIGLAGFSISDLDNSSAWGGYFEVQLESGTGRGAYAIEIDVKNKGANVVGSPYSLGAGGHGLWIVAGGDSSYGGSPANPSNSAVTVLNNSHTWNNGILIKSTAITAGGAAIKLANVSSHRIVWESAAGVTAGQISCSATTAAANMSLNFLDNLAYFGNNAGTRILGISSPGGSTAANYINLFGSIAGASPQIGVGGTDTNLDLKLTPKGTGILQVGTTGSMAANGAVATALSSVGPTGSNTTVQEWLQIKNSDGTVRYIPCF